MTIEARLTAMLEQIERVAHDLARVNGELAELAARAGELAKEDAYGA